MSQDYRMLASPGSTTSAHTSIKCDLQNNPAAPCTKCVDAGGECRIRSSKRVKNANAQNSGFASSPRREAGVQSNVVGYSDQTGSGLEQSADLSPGASTAAADGGGGRGEEMSLLSYAADVFAGSDYQPSLPQPPQRPLPDPDADAALRSQVVPPTASPAGLHNAPTTATTTAPSYVGDSGFLQIFHGIGAAVMAERQQSYGDENNLHGLLAAGLRDGRDQVPPAALQESYLETFYQFQHTWCPILDRVDGQLPAAARESVLLQNALALVGSHVDPPVLPHARAAEYYERSKVLFYSNHEKNPLLAISALMLFYCWGPGPPDVMSIDTVWWWTGVAIRQAQQLGLHREPRPGQPPLPGETPGLRRRIWWTLFARERLTSICMGRPCMINVDDCDVAELTLADFPQPATDRAEIFIQWVRLCAIIGRASIYLARRTPDTPFPVALATELQQWVTSLPDHLQLPLQGTTRAAPRFDRDVYQLHLPYLTTVTLLHLRGASHALPTPYMTAVLAAAVVARLFEDVTARGSLRYLHGIAGWAIAIAVLALLHARKVPRLARAADAHIRVLRVALDAMAKLWHSAHVFASGLERIDRFQAGGDAAGDVAAVRSGSVSVSVSVPGGPSPTDMDIGLGLDAARHGGPAGPVPVPELAQHAGLEREGHDWCHFFPYLTPETSPLVALLLDPVLVPSFPDPGWPADLAFQLQGFLDPLHDFFAPVF
ncbi:hypothetical protein HMPREF1624_01937 [Sporothrix schenckii ATCC 58251]|uniref:Xylanolytic transcriptional activator regulatory domain-containing protein n=1 Tax=Sporothrix schenckii (strain ATCC 58251 / de Perez 2211183) TaxID=1391915 RepID=U7Q117_SPOS1|nr:hypothetical protein HMPREF1624_01937 [Sporothrix schenckii ATCC 58251]